jgi:ribosome biogenesis protein Nip4
MENSDFVIINAESMWDLVHAIAYYQPKHMDMFLNKFVLHRLQGTYLQAIQKIAKCKDEETKLKLLNLLESGTEDNINLINTLSI